MRLFAALVYFLAVPAGPIWAEGGEVAFEGSKAAIDPAPAVSLRVLPANLDIKVPALAADAAQINSNRPRISRTLVSAAASAGVRAWDSRPWKSRLSAGRRSPGRETVDRPPPSPEFVRERLRLAAEASGSATSRTLSPESAHDAVDFTEFNPAPNAGDSGVAAASWPMPIRWFGARVDVGPRDRTSNVPPPERAVAVPLGVRGMLVGGLLGQVGRAAWLVSVTNAIKSMSSLSTLGFLWGATTVLEVGGTLLGGWLSDRYSRASVLTSFSAIRTAAVGAFLALMILHRLTLPTIGVTMALESLTFVVAETARGSLPATLATRAAPGDRALLENLIGRLQSYYAVGGLMGPLLTIGLGAVVGPAAIHWIAAPAFFLMTLSGLSIPPFRSTVAERSLDISHGSEAAVGASKKTGLFSDRWMRYALIESLLLAIYPLKTILPAFFSAKTSDMAGLLVLFGLGEIAGLHIYKQRPERLDLSRWVVIGIGGTVVLGLGWMFPSFPSAGLGLLVFAGTNAIGRLALNGAVQHRTPDDMRGRVNGLVRCSISGLGVILKFAIGGIFAFAPAHAWLWLAGGLACLAAIQWRFSSRLAREAKGAATISEIF